MKDGDGGGESLLKLPPVTLAQADYDANGKNCRLVKPVETNHPTSAGWWLRELLLGWHPAPI